MEERVCHCAQDLRICQIYDADESGADKVNKKDRFVRRIIIYEFSDRVHCITPCFVFILLTILAYHFLLDKKFHSVITYGCMTAV